MISKNVSITCSLLRQISMGFVFFSFLLSVWLVIDVMHSSVCNARVSLSSFPLTIRLQIWIYNDDNEHPYRKREKNKRGREQECVREEKSFFQYIFWRIVDWFCSIIVATYEQLKNSTTREISTKRAGKKARKNSSRLLLFLLLLRL